MRCLVMGIHFRCLDNTEEFDIDLEDSEELPADLERLAADLETAAPEGKL